MANTFETEDYNIIPWWKNFNDDIEEERRKISELVKKIEDPEERVYKYEELLKKLGYNEYYAYNPHLKSNSYLINLRLSVKEHENEVIFYFSTYILDYCEMESVNYYDTVENILIINVNKKFTFLNSIKTLDKDKIIEKGLIKMRREYGDEWREDDEKIYEIVFLKSY